MSALVTPSWFKQRQGKAEPAGPDTYRVSGPNLHEALVSVRRQENGRWQAVLRGQPDAPELANTEDIATEAEAWEAAFELFRTHLIY